MVTVGHRASPPAKPGPVLTAAPLPVVRQPMVPLVPLVPMVPMPLHWSATKLTAAQRLL